MKYVCVDPMQKRSHGIEHYEMLGYKVVLKKQGGVDFACGSRSRQNNTEVSNFGMVLMQIPLDDWQEIQQYGESGNTGQELADAVEDRLRDRKRDIEEVTKGHSMTTAAGDTAFILSDEKE